MELLYLFITGLFVGFASSFFGIGGGSLMVPMMYALFPSMPPQVIIPTSLGVILINSINNNIQYFKNGLSPSKKIYLIFLFTCMIGAITGIELLHYLDAPFIKNLFIGVLIIVIIKTLMPAKKELDAESDFIEHPKRIGFIGLLGAILSSLTGLGGGIIYVPLFMSFAKIPIKRISAYSNAAMLFATLFGVLPQLLKPFDASVLTLSRIIQESFIGHLNIAFIIVLFLGSYTTSKLGVRLNSTVSYQKKKYLLASVFIVFAIKMIL